MTYRIEFGSHIDWKRFRRLPSDDKERIHSMIEQKLSTRPNVFGKPLRYPLVGLWSLRIGEYRVVYRIINDTVKIELIGQRTTIYSEAERWLA